MGLTILPGRIRVDRNETYKIMEFLIIVDIFSIFLLELEIYSQDRFQKLNLKLDFFANRVIYYWNKL